MPESPAMFPKLAVVGVLDLVKVILVELANEGSKIGVFKHPREDGLCELVHILDYKAITIRAPRNDPLE